MTPRHRSHDPAPPVALLWGDSPFLLREGAAALFADRPREVDAGEWRDELLADLSTPSLFGEERGLVVTDAQALREPALEAIGRYAAEPSPGSRLVLLATVDSRAKAAPRALAGAVGPRAEVRRVAVDTRTEVRRVAVDRRELPSWVRERARGRGLSATPDGAAALVETLGEDPAALDQAVAQLAAARPEEGVTRETVAAQFRGLGDRRVWELSDAAFAGDLRAALRILAGLLEGREEPLMILGGLASRLRDLIRVRALPPRTSPKDVAREAGLRFDWQARRYVQQASRYSAEELARLHAGVVEADRTLKQGGVGGVVLARVVTAIANPEGATGGPVARV